MPEPHGRRILITGGAGFIGSYLVERLHGANHVVVLDNLRRDALGKTGLIEKPSVELLVGDVLDRDVVRRAIAGCDAVIHMASIAGVDTVLKNPVATMRVSLLGTMNLLEAAVELGNVRRFMDFSTSEVFGRYAYNVSEFGSTTLGAVGEARWTYAVAKLATEHLAFSYHKEHGLPAVSVRPFNVYGPRQVGEGAVHHFIVRALRGQPLLIHNDGSQIRAWCYVDDIVDGILLALERPEAVGQAFNIGNPRSTLTIYNLAREVVRLSSSGSRIEFVKWDQQDIELRIPNIDKARELLGFRPQVDLEEGLLRTIYWYRQKLGS
ncbi:MAG TPA: NAD-dependent epimerase/dehydratase family protein [Polyangia bacterium]|nr:NAD-dependent epimerase/dehydratase family protein [Polyangia bacterium]